MKIVTLVEEKYGNVEAKASYKLDENILNILKPILIANLEDYALDEECIEDAQNAATLNELINVYETEVYVNCTGLDHTYQIHITELLN